MDAMIERAIQTSDNRVKEEITRLRGLLEAATDKIIELSGQQKVFADALDDAWKVIITVDGENENEAEALFALQHRIERLSLHARGVVLSSAGYLKQ